MQKIIEKLENEEWRDIENYEGLYQVSNLGRVKSLDYNHTKHEKILKLLKNTKGYLFVILYKEGKKKNYLSHRLVAEAFIPNPNNLPMINHKDENPLNNCVANLEWCDSKYNNNYGTRITKAVSNTDYQSISEKLKNRQDLSKKIYQYDNNYNLIKVWKSTMECCRNGYNFSHIAACCRGERKRHKGFIWSYTPIEPIS